MQFSLETLDGLKRRADIIVDAAEIKQQVELKLKDAAKNVRVDGFRKGKVPANIVKSRFGDSILHEVLSDKMQQSFFDGIMKNKVNLAGRPTFEPKQYEDGKDFSFSATFEVYPEIEIKGLDNIEVEKPVVKIEAADIDKMLEVLRKQQGEFKLVDAPANAQSRVTIDFTGSVDGVEFEGGKATDFVLLMGQGRMIPGFEEPIVGKKAGDSFEIAVTFPADYQSEQLKGKDAKFATTVKKVEELELAEVDVAFAKKFNPKHESVDDLRGEIEKNMQRELKSALSSKIKSQVLDGLAKENPIEVPEALIEQSIADLKEQYKQRFGAGQKIDMDKIPNEIFADQAKQRVVVGLLLGKVIADFEVKADQEKVKDMIKDIASAYEDPSEVENYYLNNKEILSNIENIIIEEQAVEAILEKAKVTEKAQSFDDLINPAQ